MIVVLKTNRYLYNVVSLGDLSWLLLKFLHDLSAKNLQVIFTASLITFIVFRVIAKPIGTALAAGATFTYRMASVLFRQEFCLRNSSSESITEVS